MKKIDIYILNEMKFPVVFGVSLFTFIFLIDYLTQMAELLVVKSVPLSEVLTFLSYAIPTILVLTLPMGAFLGVMMSYGSLSSTSEIVAMQSCGMGLNRLLKTPIFFGVLIMVSTYFIQENVAPQSNQKLTLLMRKIAYTRPAAAIDSKMFTELGGYNVYVDSFDSDTNQAQNIIVFSKEDNKINPTIMVADTLDVTAQDMKMNDILMYELDDSGRVSLTGSVRQRISPIPVFFGDFNTDRQDKDSMSIKDLAKEIEVRKDEGQIYLPYEISLYNKLYTPLSSVVLCILGVILSTSHARTGKGVSFGISIVIIAGYMIAMNMIQTLAEKGVLPVSIIMFLPNLALIIITLLLYIKKARRN